MSQTAIHALRRRTPEDAIAFLERMSAFPYFHTTPASKDFGHDSPDRRDKDVLAPEKCGPAILEIRLAVAEGKV